MLIRLYCMQNNVTFKNNIDINYVSYKSSERNRHKYLSTRE